MTAVSALTLFPPKTNKFHLGISHIQLPELQKIKSSTLVALNLYYKLLTFFWIKKNFNYRTFERWGCFRKHPLMHCFNCIFFSCLLACWFFCCFCFALLRYECPCHRANCERGCKDETTRVHSHILTARNFLLVSLWWNFTTSHLRAQNNNARVSHLTAGEKHDTGQHGGGYRLHSFRTLKGHV